MSAGQAAGPEEGAGDRLRREVPNRPATAAVGGEGLGPTLHRRNGEGMDGSARR